MSSVLAAFEWHILWQRIFHPDHAFVLALWRTVFVAVVAQIVGVILGLLAALMRMSRFSMPAWMFVVFTPWFAVGLWFARRRFDWINRLDFGPRINPLRA